jgi:hypothetical protein
MGKSNKNSLRGRRNSLKGGRKRRNSLKRGRKRRVRGGSLSYRQQFEETLINDLKSFDKENRVNYLKKCIDMKEQYIRTLHSHDQRDNPNPNDFNETTVDLYICKKYLTDLTSLENKESYKVSF